jgi:hypothetical protein
MIINWLRTWLPETPLRLVANVRQMNRIANILNNIQGVNCRIEKPTNAEGKGWLIIVDGSSDVKATDGNDIPNPFEGSGSSETPTHKTLFEIYDVAATTLKVRGHAQAVRLFGVPYTVTAGSAGAALDADITISGNTYLWINVDLGTSHTATLEAGASIPDGDDDSFPFPLWYIAFASGSIDQANSLYLTPCIKMTGAAS